MSHSTLRTRDNRDTANRARFALRLFVVACIGLTLGSCEGWYSVSQVEDEGRIAPQGLVDELSPTCRAQEDCDPGQVCMATVRGLSHCQTEKPAQVVPPKGPLGQPAPPLGMLRGANRFGAHPGGAR